ncbi:MAG: membrane protein of unknown function [Promethearchaeota archaeon]|nr:MAG: membrane protein of unknown function [Candidatus Lokiarchaeota archaeon]
MKFETKTILFQFLIFILIFAPINFVITYLDLNFLYNLIALIGISIFYFFLGPRLLNYVNDIEWMEMEEFKEKYYYLDEPIEKFKKDRRVKKVQIGILNEDSAKINLFEHTFIRKLIIINKGFFRKYSAKEQKERFSEKLLSYGSEMLGVNSTWILLCFGFILIWIVNYFLINLFIVIGLI